MKKILLTFLTLFSILGFVDAKAEIIDLAFTKIGFESWSNSYTNNGTYVYSSDVKIGFNKFAKPTTTITDYPVTKAGSVVVNLQNNKTFKSIKFTLKQWTTKAKTAKLQYSINGTTFFAFDPEISSDNFVIEATQIPENTKSIKLDLSSNDSNQVGVTTIEYEINVSTPPAEPQTYTAPFDGKTFNLKVGAGNEQLEFGESHPEIAYIYNPEGVITVDENGVITPVAEGTTTVTASWVANDYWNAGTASFTAVVAKADPVSEYKDLMTPESFNVASGYSNHTFTSTTTNVEYTLKATKNNGIQINTSGSKNAKNSGIISTKNPNNLNIEKIEIVTYNSTTDLKVSVANTPGTITGSGTSTVISEPTNATTLTGTEDAANKTWTFTPTGDYKFFYIGSDGAVQITNLNVYYTPSGDPNKEDAGLAYAETAITKNTTDGTFTNPLTNPNNLTVTYTSSNPEVATVDENSGLVTIVAKGETTITATSAETDTYNKGMASYTLTVERLYNSIAEIIGENGAQNGETVKINFPMTVGYNGGSNIYATDGTNWIQLYKKTWVIDYQPKDIIPAGWSATFTLYNTKEASGTTYNDQIPELTEPNGNQKGETQGEFTIETVKATDITKAIYNKLVKIENVVFENGLPASNKTLTAEGLNYYNKHNLTADPAGIYTIIGIVSSYHDNLQIEMTQTEAFAPEIKIDGEIFEGTTYAPTFHHKDKRTIEFPTIEGIKFYYKVTQAGVTEAPALAAQEGYSEYTAPFEISGVGTLSYYAEKGSYQTAPTEIDFDIQTGVGEIEIDMTAADAEIFDMMGRRVSADRLAKGIYLVRRNGKTAKVYVK